MSIAQQKPTGKDVVDVTIMYSTHDAFRRDLSRLADAAAAGKATAPHVLAGWENFKRQLHVHHTVEDAELWPRVEAAVAGRPDALALLRDMEAEHARLEPLLNAVDRALADKPENLTPQVQELSTALNDHMKHEETSALPLIQEVLTPKDWRAFGSGMVRTQGPKGVAVYTPWVLDGATPDGRKRFLDAMPPIVRVVNAVILQRRYQRRKLWAS